jgi:hypothetical protein
MTVWLDRTFARIGRWIAIAADFLGISNRVLVYAWITVGWFVYLPPRFGRKEILLDLPLLLILIVFYLNIARKTMRGIDNSSGDTLPAMLGPGRLEWRVESVIWLLALSMLQIKAGSYSWWHLLLVLKLLVPVGLWPYLILHNGKKCKISLRERIHRAANSVRQALTPSPKRLPSPAPQPSS